MSSAISTEKALARMQTLCARAEQCTSDIDMKLRRLGLSDIDRQTVIDALLRGRFIDDNRYAKAFAHDKVKFAHWGRRKIAKHLRMKHIDDAGINLALSRVEPEEYTQAAAAAAKAKARQFPRPLSYTAKSKIYAYMVARGFDNAEISTAIAVAETDCPDGYFI